ncbi:hypothetical protein GIB67_000425 [Kingdonia uniflora]|uniref:Uncharacterized protein n=1 Tax=Kingdonia uniflora TaxID=39325 RepID=A0A7J7MPL7_9MAGN|nr:hypothetical protein GIB67_000425 [Kingdonia uniflora]
MGKVDMVSSCVHHIFRVSNGASIHRCLQNSKMLNFYHCCSLESLTSLDALTLTYS